MSRAKKGGREKRGRGGGGREKVRAGWRTGLHEKAVTSSSEVASWSGQLRETRNWYY